MEAQSQDGWAGSGAVNLFERLAPHSDSHLLLKGSPRSQPLHDEDTDLSDDSLFFFDSSAMAAWPVPTTQYEVPEPSHTLGASLLIDDEPPYDPDAEYAQSGAKQCFNCMATTHIVSDCPYKRNPQHISLARADYNSRGGNSSRSLRLHEAEEMFKRRIGLARAFEPGFIQGKLLRQGLGLNEDYGGGKEDLPWYFAMCDWGYPPGWISDSGAYCLTGLLHLWCANIDI